MVKRLTSAEIDRLAADWVVRGETGALDEHELSALENWLAGDPRHLGAYARARAAMMYAYRAKALGIAAEQQEAPTLHRLASHEPFGMIEAPEDNATRLLDRRAMVAGAASILGIGIAATMLGSQRAEARIFVTARGERRSILLVNGSVMTLNTASTAKVRVSRGRLDVTLIDGEALFEQSSANNDALVVTFANARIVTNGARFTVKSSGSTPNQVMVLGGTVEVWRPQSKERTRLSTNMRATFDRDGPMTVTATSFDEISRELSWREGMLSFEDTPLRDAATEFARYGGPTIQFEDDAIGAESVTGLFAANNPSGFAKSLALSLNLRVRREPDALVLERAQ